MRLTLKLTLGIFLGVLLVVAGHSWVTYDRQVAQFESDVRRHHQQLGGALAAAVATAWRMGGWSEARAVVANADANQTGVHIRWVALDGQHGVAAPPFRIPEEVLSALASGQTVSIRPPEGHPTDRVFTYVPVPLASPLAGAVEISESLERHREFALDSVRHACIATALIALVTGLLALLFGGWFVARPTEALVELSNRIADGDLSARLWLRQRDELGLLADAMNGMSAQLADSRARLSAEAREKFTAQQQLRHADRLNTVGKLAAGVAHELGTPLNVVSGHAQLVSSGEVSGADAQEAATIIHRQAKSMTQIIRQLLDFARRRPPAKVEVDPAEVAERAMSMLRPIAEQRGVSLEMRRTSKTRVRLDEGQISQAITNLVMNGIQAMAPEGGRLLIEVSEAIEAPPPDLGGREAPFVRIAVADEGPGIPAEVVPHIFEPFFTTKEVGEGTGLGLSVSYGLVREHGGWISVETEQGRGSRFTIHLPVTT